MTVKTEPGLLQVCFLFFPNNIRMTEQTWFSGSTVKNELSSVLDGTLDGTMTISCFLDEPASRLSSGKNIISRKRPWKSSA